MVATGQSAAVGSRDPAIARSPWDASKKFIGECSNDAIGREPGSVRSFPRVAQPRKRERLIIGQAKCKWLPCFAGSIGEHDSEKSCRGVGACSFRISPVAHVLQHSERHGLVVEVADTPKSAMSSS
jgi:hypothetical protein